MDAISFKLSGKTACFRKPDVNAYSYFTYNNIHKPALLGLLGAIIGLGGYNQLFEKNRDLKKGSLEYDEGFPEFYQELKNLKISIIPLAKNGYFSKKIQVFNNSVGYASFEEGGNLIVREQWLENPAWQIIILDDGTKVYQKIKEYLQKGKAVYIPYLGKNDHFANINDVNPIKLEKVIDSINISSLFNEKLLEISKIPPRGELSFYFKEISPIKLQKEYHFYEYVPLIFTNHRINDGDFSSVFSFDGRNYAFI
ncbi:type I-B CRISPR-associated protein Cas5b [Halarcobacter anaerophilus]|uniref:type I-B CRISPR-associated protein Cas5b n=1 Tax=Halarcobacter anaerophilus TaxID=877500 RepID=UPI0005C8BEF1|nr:type I-B CRISPR-associated protein Cas5b [Halarcobacter anaerophilus]